MPSVCNEIIPNPHMCHCWEHPLVTPSIFYPSADVDCPLLFVIPRICTLRVYVVDCYIMYASLTLASVDILPPPPKPPLTPIHCQYDHRRPNPQLLSSIYGVWISHRYSLRKKWCWCAPSSSKNSHQMKRLFLVSIRRQQSNPALCWTYVEDGGWYHLHHSHSATTSINLVTPCLSRSLLDRCGRSSFFTLALS